MQTDFDQLIAEHSGRIRAVVRRYASSQSQEDLYQDILMQLWRCFPGFRGDSRVETWIYRVSLNTAMTQVRKAIREREVHAQAKSMTVDAAGANEDQSQADVMNHFLNSLGDIDASLLMMYLDGLTAQEMSQALGVSSGAIAVRINRMKAKFKREYVD